MSVKEQFTPALLVLDEKATKEEAEEAIRDCLLRRVRITMQDGRKVIGRLRCIDNELNTVLRDAYEVRSVRTLQNPEGEPSIMRLMSVFIPSKQIQDIDVDVSTGKLDDMRRVTRSAARKQATMDDEQNSADSRAFCLRDEVIDWTVDDVCRLLDSIQLADCAAHTRERDIDGHVLHEHSTGDFEQYLADELGLTDEMDRTMLIGALAKKEVK